MIRRTRYSEKQENEPTFMLDSEPNCRQSKPWTTRPHVSVIGSCTLVSQARKLTPWKSISRGNSLNTFVSHNTIVQVPFAQPKFFYTTSERQNKQINKNKQEYPWSVKTGWLGNHHTIIQLPKHTQDGTPGQIKRHHRHNLRKLLKTVKILVRLERLINSSFTQMNTGKTRSTRVHSRKDDPSTVRV